MTKKELFNLLTLRGKPHVALLMLVLLSSYMMWDMNQEIESQKRVIIRLVEGNESLMKSFDVYDIDRTNMDMYFSGILYYDDCVIEYDGIMNPLQPQNNELNARRYSWEDWQEEEAQ